MYCPNCGQQLIQNDNGLTCPNCKHTYGTYTHDEKQANNEETVAPSYEKIQQGTRNVANVQTAPDSTLRSSFTKICPVCNKEQSVKNSMCSRCGYDFISQTEYIIPPKGKARHIERANFTPKGTKSAISKALVIIGIITVVLIVATSVYCSSPLTYGLEYSMSISSNTNYGLETPNGTVYDLKKITIVFRPDNIYIMQGDELTPSIGFYYVDDDDVVYLIDNGYGINQLSVSNRNQMFITKSTSYIWGSDFKSSYGLDGFLIALTVAFGVTEIILLIVFVQKASEKNKE